MAAFDIKGEIESLSDKQIEFLCDVLEKLGLKGNKVLIEPLGKVGDNYAANVKRIIVEKHDGTTFKMVAKVAPNYELMRSAFCVGNLFENEIIMYSKVFPMFQQLEKEAGITEDSRFTFPVCYGTCVEVPHELILLEDVSEDNYKMWDRCKPLKYDDVALIIKSLAKFHALSFVWKKKDPVAFLRVTEKMFDNYTSPQTKLIEHHVFPTMLENITSALTKVGHKDKLKELFTNFLDEARKIKESDTGSPYSVIIHGDLWINNILFKMENEKVQECLLIDYQQSNEKSPVADLHYFINSCTEDKFRNENLPQWMQLYYDELQKHLSHFAIEVSDAYPYEKFWADYKRYINFAVCCAILITNLLNFNTKELEKLKDTVETAGDFGSVVSNFTTDDLDDNTLRKIRAKVEGLLDLFYSNPNSLINN